MNTIQKVNNTELKQNRQYKPLTEQQKLHNKIEARSIFLQILFEEIEKFGGLNNAINSKNF